MLHFSHDVIVREMAGILDMAALGASEAPADLAFSLKGALRPAVRDDDVEYEGMCRCLVEMLLNKDGMFCELYERARVHYSTSRQRSQGNVPTRSTGRAEIQRLAPQPRKRVSGLVKPLAKTTHPPSDKARWRCQALLP